MKHRFTAENAANFARLSHANRSPESYSHKRATIEAPEHAPSSDGLADPFATELERAMDETLKELREADNAKDRASCAQALRNLRETYHMVTGLAKPGISKGGHKRDARPSYATPQPEPDQPVQPSQEVPPSVSPPDSG